ncbi:MAG: hypothetical protein CL946_11195 [Ectothiorhodospiraceae bacterium]|nr:hypothetical protein [Ectothiorhodospiraceae bacterium]
MSDRIAYISNRGLPIALLVLTLWAGAVVTGLTVPLTEEFIPLYIVLFAVITQLYTGLFITAHDAMHGTVYPRKKKS